MARVQRESATAKPEPAQHRARPPTPAKRESSQARVKNEVTPFTGNPVSDQSQCSSTNPHIPNSETREQYMQRVVNVYKSIIESCDIGVSIETIKSVMRRIAIPFDLLPYQIMQNRADLKKRITTALVQRRMVAEPNGPELPYIQYVHTKLNSPDHNIEGWNAAKSDFVTNVKMFPPQFTDNRYNPSTLTGSCNTFGSLQGSPNWLEAAAPTIGPLKTVSMDDIVSGRSSAIGATQKQNLLSTNSRFVDAEGNILKTQTGSESRRDAPIRDAL